MSICSKLGQNLSEMEVRTFVRIQRVFWDGLLASKAEMIQKQAKFRFHSERHVVNKYCLVMLSSPFFFSFVLFPIPSKSFFRLNHIRNVRKRCSHSRYGSQGIILGFFFLTETSACVVYLCSVKQ